MIDKDLKVFAFLKVVDSARFVFSLTTFSRHNKRSVSCCTEILLSFQKSSHCLELNGVENLRSIIH